VSEGTTTALRIASLAVGLCIAMLAGFEGRALAGPKPEPAPPPPAPALHPDPAPSAQPTPSSSSRSVPTVQRSLPVAITPATQTVPSSGAAAARPSAPGVHKTLRHRVATSTAGRSHTRSATLHRVVRLPGFVFRRASLGAISGQAAVTSGSRESRLLLLGGLALVLLVIGETTFLALAGASLGFRPRSTRRVYRGAGGATGRIPLRR
jgi:hypothetical protein